MLILSVIILVLIIVLALSMYAYLDECNHLRKRLIRLGVQKEEVMPLKKRFWIFGLKELLFEKETELAEECFLTVDKDI